MSLFPHREHTDPWFRIGRLDVTTVMFLVLMLVAAIIPWVISGGSWTIWTYYAPQLLTTGEVWRVVSWPFAEGLANGLWSVLTLFLLWYFGTALELQIGRKPMVWLLVGIWASLTITYSFAALVFSSNSNVLYGVDTIQLLVLLIWIAEYPTARFLFNIPAWAFGVVLVVVDVLVMMARRDYAGLLALLLSLVLVAAIARNVGLLSAYSWVPGRPRSSRPKPVKVPRAQARAEERRASDQERMDQLLDQISEHGLHSLTDAQRKELKRLSDRRRQG